MKRTILFVLIAACGSAQASEWVHVTASEDNNIQVEVDVSSIHVQGAIRRAWFRMVFAPHTQKGFPPNDGAWATYQVSRVQFNCTDEVSRTDAVTVYNEDGTNDSAPQASLSMVWDPVRPDTLLHGELDFVCAWKTK